MSLSRRNLLAAAAALPFAPSAAQAQQVTVTLDSAAPSRAIPADYIGLGYEISSVAVPGLLSANSHIPFRFIIATVLRDYSENGLVGIGGNAMSSGDTQTTTAYPS